MKIKQYYLNAYPTDELGMELNDEATFEGLLNTLKSGEDVYDYIGEPDSIIRERLFEELSSQLNTDYEFVYQLWLSPIKKDYFYNLGWDLATNYMYGDTEKKLEAQDIYNRFCSQEDSKNKKDFISGFTNHLID